MCLHYEKVVTRENDLVCVECGFVLERTFPGHIVVDELFDFHTREKLLDVFHNAHFPLGLIELSMFKARQLSDIQALKKFHHNTRLCFSVYETLNENQATRTPEEVAFHFDIDPLDIWKIEKILGSDFTDATAYLLEKIRCNLNLPFHLNSEILKLVYEIQEISCAKPETIIGAAIQTIVKKTPYREVSLEKISRVCGVSPASIRLLKKKMIRLL